MENKLEKIASLFALEGAPLSVEPYGEGHINTTYLMAVSGGKKYILQKINTNLFKDVDALMRNIMLVTAHIDLKKAPGERTLTLVKTAEGQPYAKYGDECYRVYDFIGNATAYQIVDDPHLFYESAVAFGSFQNKLADFDAKQLAEVLPGFHDTEKRFRNFTAALDKDTAGRAKDIQPEIEFVLNRKKYCGKFTSLLKSGEMPSRVTHNDTKLNNVLIDNATGKAVAVIDLDTVMPGSSCYDFGDSIRFGCNSAAEDEPDLTKVYFRKDLFRMYTEGYLSVLKNITPIEKENLAFSAILMTYECGMRFLTDYLDGDTYFHTKRAGQNLDRAHTQFKLVSDMERQYDEMLRIVGEIK